jgi:predicted HicB family RNase H-like nuclease
VSPPQHLHPVPHAPAAATLGSADAADAAVEPAGASTPTRFTGKAVMLAVKIPKDLRKAVRRLAKRQGRSVDVVVTEALTEHVKEHG